ncbi:uncharacterized protein PADG_02280 [Paracoccidioides brasiliensis Pb18]|uniref:Uncharacterized protein n=1 Tax=Paracoccidioides brasiliensis (strain Pb18) TaxID=502780 RepID=C1G2B4_PARBD|nr:uncharacterized protein PADG_02280 [Paracoccidioides brasiliensis Pb18]EEH46130.2 hypothetical protein PADG_02280 [Paracoccidioides brasiliensis Pb18]
MANQRRINPVSKLCEDESQVEKEARSTAEAKQLDHSVSALPPPANTSHNPSN